MRPSSSAGLAGGMSSEGGGSGSVAGSSTHSDDRRSDVELDTHLMKTIRDTKYLTRPKFITFADLSYQRECLDAHNVVRLRYGCPPLIWSQALADQAQQLAERTVEKGRILYAEVKGIGDNVELLDASHSDHLLSGEETVEKWAAEEIHFDFAKPRWRKECQHFTQMVWRESVEFGVCRCWHRAKNLVAIVALYRPGGNSNLPGDFAHNVPPPLGSSAAASCSVSCSPSPIRRPPRPPYDALCSPAKQLSSTSSSIRASLLSSSASRRRLQTLPMSNSSGAVANATFGSSGALSTLSARVVYGSGRASLPGIGASTSAVVVDRLATGVEKTLVVEHNCK